jgi:hypothetical protein
MKPVRTIMMASLLLLSGVALAQAGPGAGKGAGMGPGPGASAPGMGMGMGMGPGMRAGRGPAARWGSDFTPGWSLMTQEERTEHRNRMQSMKTYEDCKSYMDQHREQMAGRAKEKGKALPNPRREACAGLKP